MKTIIHVLLISILASGCFSINRYAGKDLVTSQSPCMDGVLVNMDGAGCEMFYFGVIRWDERVFMVRCTYSEDENFWTKSIFYSVPRDYSPIYADWNRFCSDRIIDVYTSHERIRFKQ
jgi:hypothetical protein